MINISSESSEKMKHDSSFFGGFLSPNTDDLSSRSQSQSTPMLTFPPLPDPMKPPPFGSSPSPSNSLFGSNTNMPQTRFGPTFTTSPSTLASNTPPFSTSNFNFISTSPFATTTQVSTPSIFPTTPSMPPFGTTQTTTGFPTTLSNPFGTTRYSFPPTPFSNGAKPKGSEASTPTMHVCQKCGNKSFWGSRGTPYTPTPDSTLAADHGPYSSQGKTQVSSQVEDKYISSISAMPIYQDKSHEELRWEDYQSPASGKGKTQVSVEPFIVHSTTFGHTQPQHPAFKVHSATFGHTRPQHPHLPVFMLPVALIPPNSVYNSFGFNGIP